MSRKEFSRASVLARVEAKSITLVEAVPLLGVSYRQAKRLYQRYRREGSKGLMHGNVARRSNHTHATVEREQVLSLIRAHYGGAATKGAGQRFGPTLVAEHLWTDHGVLVARSTLRDWMREAGLWSRMRKSKAPAHVRRERRAHFGELVQMDGSFHDWFEGRGARHGRLSCMMSLVDDATSTTLLRFGDEETIWAAATVLRAWIAQYGVPRALYTDWKNVYKREPTINERSRGEEAYTQFGRMCQKLGIEIIGAKSAQAKGRIERNHGTQQDRLVKKMRLLNISDDTAANEYVTMMYLPKHNAQFAVPSASAVDHHRARDRRSLKDDDVFCMEHRRVVGNDYVVQCNNQALQLDRAARGRVPAKSAVLVRETEDGRLRVVHVSRDGRERACSWTAAVPRVIPVVKIPQQVSHEILAEASSAVSAMIVDQAQPRAAPHKPGPDHPWRRQHKQWRELALLRRAGADVDP
ncbi:MAG: ISNCY family transposase [Gemmatimonadaceae bacterium]